MLIQITQTTPIDELVLAGASIDGKITQQAAFIKMGLNIPITFFFTSYIVRRNKNKFYINEKFTKLVIEPFYKHNYEYQIRTEGINETDRATDIFSETRLGLTKDNLIDNLLGVITEAEKIKKVVGLIQILPPKGLERNICWTYQIISRDDQKRFYKSKWIGNICTNRNYDAILDMHTDNQSISLNKFMVLKQE
jgi:hypothetical protein